MKYTYNLISFCWYSSMNQKRVFNKVIICSTKITKNYFLLFQVTVTAKFIKAETVKIKLSVK